jgi:hypothetical protein
MLSSTHHFTSSLATQPVLAKPSLPCPRRICATCLQQASSTAQAHASTRSEGACMIVNMAPSSCSNNETAPSTSVSSARTSSRRGLLLSGLGAVPLGIGMLALNPIPPASQASQGGLRQPSSAEGAAISQCLQKVIERPKVSRVPVCLCIPCKF